VNNRNGSRGAVEFEAQLAEEVRLNKAILENLKRVKLYE